MMRNWHDGWLCGPGSFFPGPLGMGLNLLFWVALIFLAVWLFRVVFGKRSSPPPSSTGAVTSALEVLKHRYAAGEIDSEQYERMKKDLQGD